MFIGDAEMFRAIYPSKKASDGYRGNKTIFGDDMIDLVINESYLSRSTGESCEGKEISGMR